MDTVVGDSNSKIRVCREDLGKSVESVMRCDVEEGNEAVGMVMRLV